MTKPFYSTRYYQQPVEALLFGVLFFLFITGGFLRAWFVDFSDMSYVAYSDHFINSVTAKNIVWGLGWSSSGYETYLLNPENLTSGPVVILPVALTTFLFGNHLQIPTLTMFLLNMGLFCWTLHATKFVFAAQDQRYLAAFLMVCMFACFESFFWYRMLGEIPAVLLLLTTSMYLFHYLGSRSIRSLVLGGLAGSLAMGTKELALLPILILIFVVFFSALRIQDNKVSRHRILHALYFTGLCFVLPLTFWVYKYITLQTQSDVWLSAYNAYADNIHDYYSGARTLREYLSASSEALPDLFRQVFKSAVWTGGFLFLDSCLGAHGPLWWIAACCTTSVCFFLFIRKAQNNYFHVLLGLSALPLVIWFYSISDHAFPRHLYIGVCLLVLSMIFFVSSLSSKPLRYTLSCALVAGIVATGGTVSREVFFKWPAAMQPNAVAIQDIQRYIASQPPRSIAWSGMMDNNEFEYLAKQPNNFFNALDTITAAIQLDSNAYLKKNPQVADLIAQGLYKDTFAYYTSAANKSPAPVPVTIVSDIRYDWLHFKSEVAESRETGFHLERGELCQEIIYQNEYYVIERCVTQDIQALIDRFGGLPFRPRKWSPHILYPYVRAEVF